LALLVVIISTLSWSAFYGLYGYRNLAKSLERVTELRYASEMNQHVSDLRVSLSRNHGLTTMEHWWPNSGEPPGALRLVREEFRQELSGVKASLQYYRQQLDRHDRANLRISDSENEHDTVRQIEATLRRIDKLNQESDWVLDEVKLGQLQVELEQLQSMTARLPGFLHQNIHDFTDDVRDQRRTFVAIAWTTSIAALWMLGLFVWLVYKWVFRPLRVLIKGSRKVASGQFNYRIQLSTHDEMSELAEALNDMTARFQAIRDDLDRQVQERTRQVVRSEQLASVGFLAAGVAHEINNPLASIAMCAESLEARTADLLAGDDPNHDIIRDYLRMIQDEAFRCKGITGKLLDFSRLGDVKRQPAELRDVVQGVIDMVGHLGKYQGKQIAFMPGEPVVAEVNAQEIKQVVLNLLTNGLESVDDGGLVTVDLSESRDRAILSIRDDGCGMTEEVLEHLFEPFFTRRRHGQGTGLGLSITYRIVEEHGGHIEVASDGPGRGSEFRVSLPIAADAEEKETHHRYQAA
jgi:signal transduction histidine kinase